MTPREAAIEAFRQARLGVSFHFGLYSALGRGEWVRSIEQIPAAEYRRLAESFQPDLCSMDEWARIVRSSGAKGAVLTAKHHDGFCLWDTEGTDFNSVRTPCRRDLVREFLDAMRKEGLRAGIYYSLVDWSHPDCPRYGDRQHPERHDSAWKNSTHDWPRYVDYMHRQMEELLSWYGPLDQIVLDFSYWDYTGEKWKAAELVEMMRRLQPGAVFNDRLGGRIKQTPLPWAGDYDSPELNVPSRPLVNHLGSRVDFEAWITLNNSWGFVQADREYKCAADVIRTLVNCVSKDGSLLVNLSPDGRGAIPAPAQAIMAEVGQWLALNGESIYGAGASGQPKPEWGRWTQKGSRLFAHFTEQPIGQVPLKGLRGKVRSPKVLSSGTEAFLCEFWNVPVQDFEDPEDIFLSLGRPHQNTHLLPDPRCTTVAMDLLPEEDWNEERRKWDVAKAAMAEWKPFP